MAHSQPTTTLLRRIVTEKTSRCEGDLTYVFKVLQSATKKDVFEAVEFMYGVKPTRVNMLRVKGKVKSARGKSTAGRTKDWKKAYVTLKDGDVLELTDK